MSRKVQLALKSCIRPVCVSIAGLKAWWLPGVPENSNSVSLKCCDGTYWIGEMKQDPDWLERKESKYSDRLRRTYT
jgi:hypothetical protein